MTSLLGRPCTSITRWACLPGLVDRLGLTAPLYCFTMITAPKTRREESVFLPIRLVFLFRHSIPAPHLTPERRRTAR
jgi:hypothetical protein